MTKAALSRIRSRLGETPRCALCHKVFKEGEEVFSVKSKNSPEEKNYIHIDCFQGEPF